MGKYDDLLDGPVAGNKPEVRSKREWLPKRKYSDLTPSDSPGAPTQKYSDLKPSAPEAISSPEEAPSSGFTAPAPEGPVHASGKYDDLKPAVDLEAVKQEAATIREADGSSEDIAGKRTELFNRSILTYRPYGTAPTPASDQITDEVSRLNRTEKNIRKQVVQPRIDEVWKQVDTEKQQLDERFGERRKEINSKFSAIYGTNPPTDKKFTRTADEESELSRIDQQYFAADLKGLVREAQVLTEAGVRGDIKRSWNKITKGRDWEELIPFSPSGMVKMIELNAIVGQLQNGKELTEYQQARLDEFASDEKLKAEAGKTLGSGITEGVLQMIPYAVEFMATGGVADAARQGTRKRVEKLVGDKLITTATGKGLRLLSGGSAAAATRVLLTPDELFEGTFERMLNQVEFDGDKAYLNLSVPAKDFSSAFLNATGDRFAEMAGESSGQALVKDIPRALAGMSSKSKQRFMNNVLFRMWKTSNPSGKTSTFVRTMNRLGKQSIVEEWTEERYSAVLRELLQVDKDQRGDTDLFDRLVYQSWNDALTEMGVLAVGGGPVTVANIRNRAQQNRYRQAKKGVVDAITDENGEPIDQRLMDSWLDPELSVDQKFERMEQRLAEMGKEDGGINQAQSEALINAVQDVPDVLDSFDETYSTEMYVRELMRTGLSEEEARDAAEPLYPFEQEALDQLKQNDFQTYKALQAVHGEDGRSILREAGAYPEDPADAAIRDGEAQDTAIDAASFDFGENTVAEEVPLHDPLDALQGDESADERNRQIIDAAARGELPFVQTAKEQGGEDAGSAEATGSEAGAGSIPAPAQSDVNSEVDISSPASDAVLRVGGKMVPFKKDGDVWVNINSGEPVSSVSRIRQLEDVFENGPIDYQAKDNEVARKAAVDQQIEQWVDESPILSVVRDNNNVRMPKRKAFEKYTEDYYGRIPKNWRASQAKGATGGQSLDQLVHEIWPNAVELTDRDLMEEIVSEMERHEIRAADLRSGKTLTADEQAEVDAEKGEAGQRKYADIAAVEELPDLFNGVQPVPKTAAQKQADIDSENAKKSEKTIEKTAEQGSLQEDVQEKETADAADSQPTVKAPPKKTKLPPKKKAGKPDGIEDIGEKIGGARKDVSGGSRVGGRKKAPTAKGWRSRYEVRQITAEVVQGVGGIYSSTPNEGKWAVFNKRKKAGKWSLPRPVGNQYFDTEEEAGEMLPIMAVGEKHRVQQIRGGDKYSVFRLVTDRKRVRVVPEEFDSRDDGMKFMVQHANEILSTKLNFGEEVLPKPEKVYRQGESRREGDVSGDDFIDQFGFRGVEFGNWVSKTEERQEVMNHAYDALLDMAEVLGIPAKAVSLNGELALAFGARGHGLSGAAAHYERDYGVINLTKMAGAGHLAHEWFHAFDHYIGRQDGKTKSEKVENERGDLVYPASINSLADMATGGFSFGDRSGVREEIREAFDRFVKTMLAKGETYVEDTQKVERFLERARDELGSRLKNIRDYLARELDYGKRNTKPATDEQLKRFDELSKMLIDGDALETAFVQSDQQKRRRSFGGRFSNPVLDEMSAIYKAVRGREGFSESGDNTFGRLRGPMENYRLRIQLLKEAEAGTQKEKKIPTSFKMQAIEADQGRSKNYWSDEHELAARAFAAYVEDKLAENDGKSFFLVYHAHGAVAVPVYPEGFFRPYPEGEERKAINAAFDELFGTLEAVETDKGVMLRENAAEYEGGVERSGTAALHEIADEAPAIEFSQENWDKLFPAGRAQTPMGEVKLGENQYHKMVRHRRQKQLGMMHSTLTDPMLVIEDRSGAWQFIKSFRGGRRGHQQFMSVAVSIDEERVVITNHQRKIGQVERAIKEGKLVFMTTALDESFDSLRNQLAPTDGVSSKNQDKVKEDGGRLDLGKVEEYLGKRDVEDVEEARKQLELQWSGVSEADGGAYPSGRESGADAGKRRKIPKKKKSSDAQAYAIVNPDVADYLKEAFKETDRISSLVPEFLNEEIQNFDYRGVQISEPRDFAALMMPLRSPYVESLKVAFLDKNRRIISSRVVTVGLLDSSLIHQRELLRGMPEGTAGVMIAHNHPSGDPTPSQEDVDITKKLRGGLKLAGVPLVDHVITNGGKYVSLNELGFNEFDELDGSIDSPLKGVKKRAVPEMRAQEPWERVRRDVLKNASQPEQLSRIAAALRQADGNYGHVIYVSNSNAVLGIERVPLDMDAKAVSGMILRGATREGSSGFFLDWPVNHTIQHVNFMNRVIDLANDTGIPLIDISTLDKPVNNVFREEGRRNARGFVAEGIETQDLQNEVEQRPKLPPRKNAVAEQAKPYLTRNQAQDLMKRLEKAKREYYLAMEKVDAQKKVVSFRKKQVTGLKQENRWLKWKLDRKLGREEKEKLEKKLKSARKGMDLEEISTALGFPVNELIEHIDADYEKIKADREKRRDSAKAEQDRAAAAAGEKRKSGRLDAAPKVESRRPANIVRQPSREIIEQLADRVAARMHMDGLTKERETIKAMKIPWVLEEFKKTLITMLDYTVAENNYGPAREALRMKVRDLENAKRYLVMNNGEEYGLLPRAVRLLDGAYEARARETAEEGVKRILDMTKKFSGRMKTRQADVQRAVSARIQNFYKMIRGGTIGQTKYEGALLMTPDAVETEIEEIQKFLEDPEKNAPSHASYEEQRELVAERLERLNALMRFGALKHRNPNEVADAADWLENHMAKAMEEREIRRKQMSDIADKSIGKLSKVLPNRLFGKESDGGWKDFNSRSQFLRFRLEGLVRYGKGEDRIEALKLMDELAFEFTRRESEKNAAVYADNSAFGSVLVELYGKPSKAGLGEARDQIDRAQAARILRTLTKQHEEYAKFSFKGRMLSKQNLLQIVGSMAQEDVRKVALLQLELEDQVNAMADKPVKEVAEALWQEPDEYIKYKSPVHGYELDAYQMERLVSSIRGNKQTGPSRLARRLEMVSEIEKELSVEDFELLDWLRDYYRRTRAALSEKNEQVTGLPFPMSDPNYIPLKRDFNKPNLGGYTRIMPLVPPALSPRTFSTMDIDEEAGAIDLYMQRLEGNQQFLHFADLYQRVSMVFNDGDLSASIENTHGKNFYKQLIEHMNDALSGNPNKGGGNRQADVVDKIVNFMAATRLGFNISLLPRQVTSLPAFGMYVDVPQMIKYASTAFTKDGLRVMREMAQHPYVKERMKQGHTQVQRDLFEGFGERGMSFWEGYKRLGQLPTKYGDIIPTLVFGQGYYRALIDQAKQAGKDPEEARKWAMDRVWDVTNMSQQSGMLNYQAEWQRHGGSMGRALGQFISTPQQFWAKQTFDWREFRAAQQVEGWNSIRTRKAAGQLTKTVMINHLVLPFLYNGIKILYNAMLGDRPDEDDAQQLFISMLAGPFSGIFILGAAITSTIEAITTGNAGFGNDLVPAGGVVKDVEYGALALWHILTLDVEEAAEYADRFLKGVQPVYRDVRKVMESAEERKDNRPAGNKLPPRRRGGSAPVRRPRVPPRRARQ